MTTMIALRNIRSGILVLQGSTRDQERNFRLEIRKTNRFEWNFQGNHQIVTQWNEAQIAQWEETRSRIEGI